MKRRTKRFDEGGEARAIQASKGRPEMGSADLGGTGLKRETFSDAFARARRNKEKTFEFQGKTYGTALKGETGTSKAQTSSSIDTGIAAGKASTGRTRARPEDYEQDVYKKGRFENKMNRSIGRTTDPENAAKIQAYEDARRKTAAERKATAEQTQSAGVSDMGTLRRSGMDAYVPVDEQRIYSQFKKGGKVKSASARADGCAVRGKTRA